MLPHQILALGTQNRKGRFGFSVVQAGFEPTHSDRERFYLYQRDMKSPWVLRELEPTSSGTWGRIWTNSDSDSSSPRARISGPCSVPQLPFTQFFLQARLSLLSGLQACRDMNSQPSRHLATLLKTHSYLLYTVSAVFSKVWLTSKTETQNRLWNHKSSDPRNYLLRVVFIKFFTFYRPSFPFERTLLTFELAVLCGALHSSHPLGSLPYVCVYHSFFFPLALGQPTSKPSLITFKHTGLGTDGQSPKFLN